MNHSFIPLIDLQRHLGLDPAAISDSERSRLLRALDTATAAIEALANRRLSPYRLSRPQRADSYPPNEIILDADLLTLESVTDGDGQPIALADVEVLYGSVLRRIDGGTFARGESALPVMVTGVWGFHPTPSIRWRDSDDTVVSLSGSVLTVNNADGADSLAESPRFDAGMVLRVGEEYLRVLAVNTTTDTLTVKRGVDGTTETTHAVGTPIDIYTQTADITALVVRWAAWLYREPDAPGGRTLPADLLDGALSLRRVGVRA